MSSECYDSSGSEGVYNFYEYGQVSSDEELDNYLNIEVYNEYLVTLLNIKIL